MPYESVLLINSYKLSKPYHLKCINNLHIPPCRTMEGVYVICYWAVTQMGVIVRVSCDKDLAAIGI